jgi:predicted phosphodiesterase
MRFLSILKTATRFGMPGVYGNIDGTDVRQVYPEHLRFMCEKVDVWMTHIGGYPDRYAPDVKREIYTKPPGLFISGHSHILKVIYDKKINCLHLNPGAAGKQGWHKVRTLIRFSITDEKIHTLDVIELHE